MMRNNYFILTVGGLWVGVNKWLMSGKLDIKIGALKEELKEYFSDSKYL